MAYIYIYIELIKRYFDGTGNNGNPFYMRVQMKRVKKKKRKFEEEKKRAFCRF